MHISSNITLEEPYIDESNNFSLFLYNFWLKVSVQSDKAYFLHIVYHKRRTESVATYGAWCLE